MENMPRNEKRKFRWDRVHLLEMNAKGGSGLGFIKKRKMEGRLKGR